MTAEREGEPLSEEVVVPLEPSLTLMLLTGARYAERLVEDALIPLALTLRKFGVLAHLRRDPGLSYSELARRASITVQSMHVIVQALIQDGFVVSENSERQGRVARLKLSETGDRRMHEAHAAFQRIDAELFGDGDIERRARIDDTLGRVIAIARDQLSPPSE